MTETTTLIKTLTDIGRLIVAGASLEELPALIYREAGRVLDITNFFVTYYDEAAGQNDFRLRYEHGVIAPPLRLSIDRDLAGWVARRRQPLLLAGGISCWLFWAAYSLPATSLPGTHLSCSLRSPARHCLVTRHRCG